MSVDAAGHDRSGDVACAVTESVVEEVKEIAISERRRVRNMLQDSGDSESTEPVGLPQRKVRNRLQDSGSSESERPMVEPARVRRIRNRLIESDSSGSNLGEMTAVGHGLRRRRRARQVKDGGGVAEITHVTDEMSAQRGGVVDDLSRCRARVWVKSGACPGKQCTNKPVAGEEFCGMHGEERWQRHGRIDRCLPLELYRKF